MKKGVNAVERERLGNGNYRVFVSDEELREWGLSFDGLDGNSPTTKALLSAILTAIGAEEEWGADGVTAEAFPAEGGCFLLLSGRHRYARKRRRRPLIAVFSDADGLFSFSKAVAETEAASALYTWNGNAVLVVDTDTKREEALLWEFGAETAYGATAAAFLAEHGTLVFADHALQRLNELG